MFSRNFSMQWLLIIILLTVILFFKIELGTLNSLLFILTSSSFYINIINIDMFTKSKVNKLTEVENYTKNMREFKSNTGSEKFEDITIIYNRVPKTGSTSFVGVVYDLCKKNKFHTLHINITNNMHTLTLYNQIQFITNVTQWDVIKPAFYHGHIAFLNFNKFGVKRMPLYLNLLRKPLDRFVSYYYFLRYGDNFRPHLIRKKYGDTKTFDECVKASQADCDPSNMEVGNRWALEEAKRNLVNNYFLVGVTEELDEFIHTLQIVLPSFFRGAHDMFSHSDKSHLRQTIQKIDPLPETVKKIQNSTVWKMENELYNFALSYFHSVKKRLINASSQDLNQHFMYEKIRPNANICTGYKPSGKRSCSCSLMHTKFAASNTVLSLSYGLVNEES
ncbi:Similar to Hs2st: Heparin sulfate O-sulfotransferase (Drosophila melanogaster) [Cotesia congregata]|uniref:Similar to Hs2st: Heparin sulfate O-sulfotransferase (Drosophila melanogaster) n=1 Tax=Cotesia congregata TaxID=51543 RepID=A0A8J2HIF0_COTCN|nr:Similar to Hs2st: Heparin sulfate O-sulfotransferase (Drosophila melanogaster) [Cotesia congregata]